MFLVVGVGKAHGEEEKIKDVESTGKISGEQGRSLIYLQSVMG